jgi:UDP-N-acetylglucosamine 2-epimerase
MIVKRKAAIAAGIWDTCNLEFPGTIVRKLVKPEVPTLDDMIRKLTFMDQLKGSTAILVTRKARIKDLSDNKKEELVFQKTLYVLKIHKHETELKSYNKFVKDIISSIDPEFVLQLGDTDTAYEFFCAC